MLKCKELSRLPKAASAKYVNFRRQTPGCISELLKPGNPLGADYLDPSHPAIRTPKKHFPSIRNETLGVKAFPFALLTKPEQVWAPPLNSSINTWKERVQALLSANEGLKTGEVPLEVAPIMLPNIQDNAISMSFANATSKKRTSNNRVIRRQIAARLKVVINLIVARDADVVEVNGKRKIVLNETGAKENYDKWIHPGWTYIFFPTLEVYRMPYHEMIPLLRKSLRKVYDDSQNLERKWASNAITPQKAHPIPHMPYRQARAQPTQGSIGKAPVRRGIPHSSRPHTYREYSTKRRSTGDATNKSHSRPSRPKAANALPKSKKHAAPSHMTPIAFTLSKVQETTGAPPGSTSRSVQAPVIRLGGVTFKANVPPIMVRDPPKSPTSAASYTDYYEEMKEVKTELQQILSEADKLAARKQVREHISRRIVRRESKQREPLGPEFLGFTSQPNPSHDPFKNMEPSPTREVLLKLLNKDSARTPPRSIQIDPFIGKETSLSELSKLLNIPDKPSGSDHFDPFAPLIPAHDSPDSLDDAESDTTMDTPSDPLTFDPFPYELPENALSSKYGARSSYLRDPLLSFDPFRRKEPQDSSKPPRKLHERVKPAELLRRANAARLSRAESAARLRRLAKKMRRTKSVMLSWRSIRRALLPRRRRHCPL